MERKLFDGWGLFITKDLSYVGFFTDDRVCLIDIEADGIQIIENPISRRTIYFPLPRRIWLSSVLL